MTCETWLPCRYCTAHSATIPPYYLHSEVDVPSATAAVMMAHAQAGAADPGLGLAEASTTRASAPQQDATADPRAHRRVPSWVHEYVLGVEEDPAGRDDRAEAACNSAPTTGSGRAAALGLQDVAGTGWSLWTSPSNLTRSSQPQQQQPGRRAAASVTTALLLRRYVAHSSFDDIWNYLHCKRAGSECPFCLKLVSFVSWRDLRSLYPWLRGETSSICQRGQARRSLTWASTCSFPIVRAAPELDLSWVAKLPTPPTNKPLRK